MSGYRSTAEMIRDMNTGELTHRYHDILGQYGRCVLHDEEEADQRLAEVSDTLIETARELIGRLTSIVTRYGQDRKPA